MAARRAGWPRPTTLRFLAAAAAVLVAARSAPAQAVDLQRRTSSPAQGVDLQQRISSVQVKDEGGRLAVEVDADGGPRTLTPEEFVRAIAEAHAQQEAKGFLYRLFNITTPWGFLWVSLGFLGQALFTFRMVLQWLVSEKEKRSVVPVGFWWGSLFGGLMLFVYFAWRKDIVGILGQSTGVFVYARNLMLIYRGERGRGRQDDRGPPTVADDLGPEPALDR